MTAKERYNEVHRKYQCDKTPSVCADGFYSPPKYPKVATANGLQRFIVDYLNWTSNHGERTNTMGRPIQKYAPKFNIMTGAVVQVESGIEWQKGTGIKGSSDVKGHINVNYQKYAIPVYIEVKIKDRQSDDQIEYERKVNKTGGLYVIVKSPDDFLKFYDDVVMNRII
jgi:hypothetical protein